MALQKILERCLSRQKHADFSSFPDRQASLNETLWLCMRKWWRIWSFGAHGASAKNHFSVQGVTLNIIIQRLCIKHTHKPTLSKVVGEDEASAREASGKSPKDCRDGRVGRIIVKCDEDCILRSRMFAARSER